ncbi:MAG TPA: hypothetical protein VFA86_02680 [Gammaproteobacteria bacterium]|nr:hypothetical protein [Gammaproteobacteria bacterium]
MPYTHQKLQRIRFRLERRLKRQGCRYWDTDRALRELAWLFSRGVPLEDLDHLACTCGSWSGFFSAAHERLCGEVLDPSRPRPACAPSEKETESGRE